MRRNLSLLALYAIAMVLLEAAVVYLRQLHYADDPLNLLPSKFLDSHDTAVELSLGAATAVMILVVALLAERTSRTRMFAAFVFVFGLWVPFRGSRRRLLRELVAAENQERTVLSRLSNQEWRRVVRTTPMLSNRAD